MSRARPAWHRAYRANPAWHCGYDEGQAAADQELAVCAPPDEYDSLEAIEFMAGWHAGLRHHRPVTPASD